MGKVTATKKQKRARARNYFKMVIAGLPKPIDGSVLSLQEKESWLEILRLRQEIIKDMKRSDMLVNKRWKEEDDRSNE